MGKSNGNTIVQMVCQLVPAADASFDFDIPAGAYLLAAHIKSNVTGATTSVTFHPWIDEQKSQVDQPLFLLAPNDTAFNVGATRLLVAGLNGRQFTMAPMGGTGGGNMPLPLPHGLRLRVVKGAATTGERLEVTIVACRVDGNILEPVA